jgi:SsrA-binding protein
MAKTRKRKAGAGAVATNRQASYRFNLLERFECGLVLTGTEVKSLREGNAQLKDAYAVVRDGEVWLIGLYIAPYGPAARENHDPERQRKLLLHKSEIERVIGLTRERGLTLVRGRVPRSRSRSREARTCTTSATRSRSGTWRETCNASCARLGSRPAASH